MDFEYSYHDDPDKAQAEALQAIAQELEEANYTLHDIARQSP